MAAGTPVNSADDAMYAQTGTVTDDARRLEELQTVSRAG
jgi:hypothetical protein